MANYCGCIIFATIIYLTSQVVGNANASVAHVSDDNFNNKNGNGILELFPRRAIRAAPNFQLFEMSTARGYGKRNVDYNLHGWESHLLERMIGYNDHKRGSTHGIDLREPRLRFRMENDGGLRIGRGFGKRSVNSGQKEECKIFDL